MMSFLGDILANFFAASSPSPGKPKISSDTFQMVIWSLTRVGTGNDDILPLQQITRWRFRQRGKLSNVECQRQHGGCDGTLLRSMSCSE